MDDRSIVKCLTCNLVQYQTRTQRCRRCNHSIEVKRFELPTPTVVKVLSPTEPVNPSSLFRPISTLDMPKLFGAHLKNWREAKNMTQGTFVAKARKLFHSHLSRSYLSRVESSQMTFSIGHIETALKCLEVSPHEFFNGYEKDWFMEGVVAAVSKVPVSNRPLILNAVTSLTLRTGFAHREQAQDIAITYGVDVVKQRSGRKLLYRNRNLCVETRAGV